MTTSPAIRPIRASDEARWRELWDAYTRFYDRYTPHSGFLRYTLRLPLS